MGSILAEWKAEGVYPYQGEPRSAAEEVEREIFDIVAVVASPAIGRDVKQKKLSLRLLQEATRAEPSRTNRILNAVLDLTDEEQEVLFDQRKHAKFIPPLPGDQAAGDVPTRRPATGRAESSTGNGLMAEDLPWARERGRHPRRSPFPVLRSGPP
jgi:hypothetical protein